MLTAVGYDVEPTEVTRGLGMFPDQAWSRGEFPKIMTPDGRLLQHPQRADWGGWKKFMPDRLRGEHLAVQLEHWATELDSKREVLRSFLARGWSLTLNCYVDSSDITVIELKAELLSMLALIGVDIELHFYPDSQ